MGKGQNQQTPVNGGTTDKNLGKGFQTTGKLHSEPKPGDSCFRWNHLPNQAGPLNHGLESQVAWEFNTDSSTEQRRTYQQPSITAKKTVNSKGGS